MAKFAATDYLITLNAGTVSPNLNSVELNLEAEDIETTAFGEQWRTRIAGLKSATVTLNFMQDFGAGAIDETLYPLFGSFATVVIRPFGGTTISSTNPAYTAVCLVTEYQPFASSTGDLAEFSVTWPVTGEVERGTA
jgi:hypothetical protein